MMRIPFELAETVAAVVDEGTLDAAARRLHITPSAVSQRIKALEEQLGRVVLVRSKPARLDRGGGRGRAAWRARSRCSSTTRSPSSARTARRRTRTTVPLAVNADSLATWFLEPLARLSERHPVVFELHRDDQDFTAGLLESGTVMGAVTSRSTPVAGCRVSALGAMRYEAVATPAFVARWLPDGATRGPRSRRRPLVDFDRRDDLQTQWLRACGIDESLPARHYVPASNDFATAVRLGLGWALLPRFQSREALDARRARARSAVRRSTCPCTGSSGTCARRCSDAIADEIVAEGRRVLSPMPAGGRS